MVDKQMIIELLKTNDKAVCRALVAIANRQTEDEKIREETKYRNGRGFRPCHARVGVSMAEFYKKTGFLTKKQIEYWRKTQKDGKMRIEVYASQLLQVSQEREATKKDLQPA